ncbi:hypothetical protein OV320_2600 [Actinobacteria bacterium OV320]|jgi:hypothetical protein|nr:hypothetical protein OV320_2600 [Actinobacteria bacterium OV320]
MPTTPFIPAQRTVPVWESHQLFREPQYENGVPWTPEDDDSPEDDG